LVDKLEIHWAETMVLNLGQKLAAVSGGLKVVYLAVLKVDE
jgi:hypothetical protein